MIRYTYTVVKAFILSDASESQQIVAITEKVTGTRFEQGVKYVDYAFPSKKLVPSAVTEILVDEGYIQLVKEETIDLEEN